MSDELAPTPEASDPALTEADYAAISGLLMESARGRWFLAEYARRNRQADTQLVLAAIARIESAVSGDTPSVEGVRLELAEMATAIARLESEIAALKPEAEREGDAQEVVQLVRELGGRIDAMIASWAHAPAVSADVSAPKAEEAVAEPAPVTAKIEVPARPAIDTDDIVWVEGERVRHSAGGLPGPIPAPPAAERIPEIELPEISFVALPTPELRAGQTLPAGMPTTDMLADIFDLEAVPAVPEAAEAEPEALPVQEPVSPAEIEALTAAALALLAQAEDAVGEIAAAVAEPEPAMAGPGVTMAEPAPPAPPKAERPADPLAPLYALSEDEKIALFG